MKSTETDPESSSSSEQASSSSEASTKTEVVRMNVCVIVSVLGPVENIESFGAVLDRAIQGVAPALAEKFGIEVVPGE